MQLFSRFIGSLVSFSRARARVYKCNSAILAVILFLSVGSIHAADPEFIRDAHGAIHGLVLNSRQEAATRKTLKILTSCVKVKKSATAMNLKSSENVALIPHLKTPAGVFVLEAIQSDGRFKTLDTELGGVYKNFPTSMPGIIVPLSPLKPLAVTIAAPFTSQGDLVLAKGDSLGLKSDGQLYAFPLPAMKIPSGGMLRVYVGTDDTLYLDPELKHPMHEGRCKTKAK